MPQTTPPMFGATAVDALIQAFKTKIQDPGRFPRQHCLELANLGFLTIGNLWNKKAMVLTRTRGAFC